MSFAALRQIRVALIVFALGVLVSGCGVNNIPTFEEQAKAKWSDVHNQYQRRADLIPNLVETVNGYAKQEREALEAVVERARQGDLDSGRRPTSSTTRPSSSSSRRRRASCPARSAA